MKKLAALAVAVGLVTASCSGHAGGGALPPGTAGPTSTGSSSGTLPGTGATRSMAVLTAPSGWAATGTQALSLTNATDLGALTPTQSLTIRLGLQLRNVAQLQQLVASHQTIDQGTFMANYAPTAAQVQSVESYLQAQGFTSVSVEPNNLIISATASAAQAEQAFNTTIHAFSQNGLNVFANTAPAYVPQSLGGLVVAVLGLSDEQTMAPNPHHKPGPSPSPSPTPAPQPTPTVAPASPCSLYGLEIIGFPTPVTEPTTQAGCLRNYSPADFWRAYDALNSAAATSQNIAIMTAGGLGSAISDLRVNEQADGLVQVPVVVKQVGLAAPVISGGPDEWTLDMTASSGMARALQTIYVYNTTSLTDSDIALMYNRWVTDDIAKIGNSSFGGCEFGPYLDGSMVLDDEIFLQGAAQGQTMFVSSGDTGSFCSVGTPNGVPAGVPMVEYPASSPYVTAVGGTTLVTMSDGSYQGEAAWYSGGGGLSQFEYAPYWEGTAQPVAQNVGSFRGVPDVAMDADLQTGMNLYLSDQGGWTIIGGTSLASPLAAGSWARIEQAHGGSLGFAPPLLYADFTGNAPGAQQTGPPPWQPDGGFHDIIVGANGSYTAAPGYDYTTGLGSFDVGAMNATIGT